ncbi:DUF4124 domain-containing protein [Rhodanobacter sp. L36]|uniref:DUF4124 domain-containing protein n=1 Tax=Rhodanobacter sp. L36 TaxID=1747221 RepID=UPI0020B15A33|nr:DUF4124 domain-containing protein [Rhodanobacter sp. L36]
MKIISLGKSCFLAACMLAGVAGTLHAQNIYKCTQGGKLEFTDHPCPGKAGELIHQADDREIIDQYLDLGQDDIARRYATTHHLDALYKERVEAYRQNAQAKAEKAVLDARQRQEQARQQALANEASERERLRDENNALRQQNEDYRDQLAQPAENPAPVVGYAPDYGAPPYRDHDHGHDHNHDPGNGHEHDPGKGSGNGSSHPPPPPPVQPVIHPCRQIAGGQSIC